MRQLNAFTGKLSRVLLAIVLSFSLSPIGYAFAADEAPDAVQEGTAGEGSDSGAAQGDQPGSDDPESGGEGEGQQAPEAPAAAAAATSADALLDSINRNFGATGNSATARAKKDSLAQMNKQLPDWNLEPPETFLA